METSKESINNVCCYGCLCNSDELKIEEYYIRCSSLHSLLQMDSLPLCYICKRMAQHAELFMQSVLSNQILLANYHNILDASLQAVISQVQPLINLSCQKEVQILEYIHDCQAATDVFEVITSKTHNKVGNIKIEFKNEDDELSNLDVEYIDNCEVFEDHLIKDEDEFPLEMLRKARGDLGNIEKSRGKSMKKNKVKKKKQSLHGKKIIEFDDQLIKDEKDEFPSKRLRKDRGFDKLIKKTKVTKKKHKLTHDDNLIIDPKIVKIYITKTQCLAEREKMATDSKYLRSAYKCEDCLKGFTFKDGYDKHMMKHSESNGSIQCGICKQRMDTEEKLARHNQYHFVRYKCPECDLTRICRQTLRDHYTAFHCQDLYQYVCTHPGCFKVYNRQSSLRKHKLQSHRYKERVSCQFCLKTYVTREVLKSHIIMQHPKEVSENEVRKNFVCQECGMAFKMPSQLSKHSMKHTHTKSSYCVDCDKSFKSEYSLKHHLKTASSHVNYDELPLVCSHCEKRFAVKRDLERHINRLHLNIKPYKCDKCDKAYTNAWSLMEHKRFIHEGYKRPLNFPCNICDKVFDRKQILVSHVRTHTGERPFECARCPAAFAQRGVLATHVRLVHLRLARNGRPKH